MQEDDIKLSELLKKVLQEIAAILLLAMGTKRGQEYQERKKENKEVKKNTKEKRFSKQTIQISY